MARRSDHSRAEIRDMAIRAARYIVETRGYGGLTARGVARHIGYTVGTLYLVFENLDELVMTVNLETVTELRESLERASRREGGPADRIRALAGAYVRFAMRHSNRWRMLFDHHLPEGRDPPETLLAQNMEIFALVAAALREFMPGRSGEEVSRLTTALWSGIHGVCILSVGGKVQPDARAPLSALADTLVSNFLAGLKASD